MWDDEYDFDYFGGSDYGDDLSGFDFSNLFDGGGGGGFDMGGMGDIANLFTGVDLGGGGFDLGGMGDIADLFTNYDLGGGGFDIGGMGNIADLFISPDIDGGAFDQGGMGNIAGLFTSTDAEAQEGGFYGNTPGAYYDPRTNLTTLYNEDSTYRDFVTHEEDGARVGGGYSEDAEQQAGGFYGNTPNAQYDPSTNKTTLRDDQGNVTKVIDHNTGKSFIERARDVATKGAEDAKNPIAQLAGINDKTAAMLAALLGGILGLLNKPKDAGPVGYQGKVSKIGATRSAPTSPTAGGRTPGGAGIPSLAGNVTYQKAAQGGLMGLKEKGLYLGGKTDGMADEIETSIDGEQPALLSHGEFVLPSDVVSHLGNGNSDAGAEVLYDMMERIRKERTGNPKQGKQINPNKLLPV